MDDKFRILLGSAKSVDRINNDNVVNITAERTQRQIVDSSTVGTLDLNERFMIEREKCKDYRVILSISPFCTNVLCNACTEITMNEGSDSVIDVTNRNLVDVDDAYGKKDNLSVYDMIRNSEYSRESIGYEYHPGLDFFNNHILRNVSYRVVNPLANGEESDTFNTIEDYMRQANGSKIKKFNRLTIDDTTKKEKHLYDATDILRFDDGSAISENLIDDNGWIGFKNPSVIPTKDLNGNDMDISRAINNKGNCEFVDMYPDRSLFSFIPKINKYRRRLEYNWDIELTYAFDKSYDSFLVQEGDINGLYVASVKYETGTSGVPVITFRTLTKHNLKTQDFVKFKYSMDDGTNWKETKNKYWVIRKGDVNGNEPEYCFYINNLDLLEEVFYQPNDDEPYTKWDYIRDLFYHQVSSIPSDITPINYGTDGLWNIPTISDTYIVVGENFYVLYNRETQTEFDYTTDDPNKFLSSIINNLFTPDSTQSTSSGSINNTYVRFRLVKTNGNVDCDYYIRKLKKIPNMKYGSSESEGLTDMPFDNEKYPLAFAETIYGDQCMQAVYTDNVKLGNLKDNLGRQVSEIFVTVVKSNRGYNEWYGSEQDKGSENVEFSHCFGPVTCGPDIHHIDGESSDLLEKCREMKDVHMITNNRGVTESMNTPNEFITIEDEWFFGDIVEFNPFRYTETTLCDIDFRFNTAQREFGDVSNNYSFKYDEITTDDFGGDFTINTVTEQDNVIERPEGYFYKPHYKIKLKGFGSLNQATHKFIKVKEAKPTQMEGMFIKVTAPLQHKLEQGNEVILSELSSGYEWRLHATYIENKYTFVMEKISRDDDNYRDWITVCDGLNNGTYTLKKVNELIPDYAVKTNTNTYVWRNQVSAWDIDNTDTDLKEYLFTNGCFYVDETINFYLKRQDPFDKYGLYFGGNSSSFGVVGKEYLADQIGIELKDQSEYIYKEDTEIVC